MKISDILKYSFKKKYSNKKNISIIVLDIITILLVFITFEISANINDYINNEVNKNVESRSLLIPPNIQDTDNGIEQLSKIDKVKVVFNSKYAMASSYTSNFENKNIDGVVGLLYATIDNQPNIIKGRKFKKNDSYKAICPEKFYPDRSAYNLNIKKSEIIFGNDLLNSTINLTFKNNNITKNFDFEVIGIYDTKESMNYNNECYVLSKDMESVVEFTMPSTDGTLYANIVVVENIDDLEYVKKKIKDIPNFLSNDYTINTKSTIQHDSINKFRLICIMIVLIALIVNISLVTLMLKKKFVQESYMIKTLKAIGYNDKCLILIYFFEILIINIISYLLSLIIFMTLFMISTKYLFPQLEYSIINLRLNIFALILTFIISLIPCLTSIISINKNIKEK